MAANTNTRPERLDPLPYRGVYPFTTTRSAWPVTDGQKFITEWAPRPGYSKDKDDYQ